MLEIVLGVLVAIGVFVFWCDVTDTWNTMRRWVTGCRAAWHGFGVMYDAHGSGNASRRRGLSRKRRRALSKGDLIGRERREAIRRRLARGTPFCAGFEYRFRSE